MFPKILVFSTVAVLSLGLVDPAFAQVVNCSTDMKLRDLEPHRAIEIATECVGWIKDPSDTRSAPKADKSRALLPTAASNIPGAAQFVPAEGVTPVVDELLSLIVEIAVDKAKRQGLALVKQRIEDGVCELRFNNSEVAVLPATCRLIRSSDLQVLVGQSRALKSALTSDVIHAVEVKALTDPHGGDLIVFEPIANALRAGLSLVRRFAADPDSVITRNDIWLVVDAFLNTPCKNCDITMRPLQVALSAARIYVQSIQLAKVDGPPIDLAQIVRGEIAHAGVTFDSKQYASIIEYTNVAVRAGLALTAHGTSNHREGLRDALRLIFEAVGANNDPDTDPKAYKVKAWARSLTLAALDGDAPRLVAGLAEMAREQLIANCGTGDQCQSIRKFAMLLTGVATYALTYQNEVPDGAPQEERAAILAERRQARKEALESVIDAATDRSGREGASIWSLGIGIGASTGIWGDSGSFSNLKAGEFQLHAPLGVSYQVLPGPAKFPGLHLTFSILDLANYIGKTTTANTTTTWRSIFAPGIHAAWAIPKLSSPSNLFLVGASYSYAPQYGQTAASESATAAFVGARRVALFVSYYVPLWDFN